MSLRERTHNEEETQDDHEEDCFDCEYVDCFQLYDSDKEDSNIGRELHFGKLIYKKINEENEDKLDNIICLNNYLFQMSCFLVNAIPLTSSKEILRDNVFLAVRDLKASSFLAITGYYSNAMQVLRCSFETLLYALKFSLKLKEEQSSKEVMKKYKRWKKGKYKKPIHSEIKSFATIGFLTEEEKSEWSNFYSILSKYIHSPRSSWGRNRSEKKFLTELLCIADSIYDFSALEIWSKNYRTLLYILFRICLYFEPQIKEHEFGIEALELFNHIREICKDKTLLKRLEKLFISEES